MKCAGFSSVDSGMTLKTQHEQVRSLRQMIQRTRHAIEHAGQITEGACAPPDDVRPGVEESDHQPNNAVGKRTKQPSPAPKVTPRSR